MKDPAKAKEAVAILDSSDPENDGRRIERVPGGWIVLNARKYRDLVTREEKTRIRVARYRERNVAVRKSNPKVTHPNDSVTQSKADTETKSETNTEASLRPVLPKREKKTVEVSDQGLKFAQWFRTTLPDNMHLAANWQVNWAKVFDDMMRIDSRTPEQIHTVCKWARNDPFWSRNFMSPTKLREKKNEVQYFDAFLVKMKGTSGNIAAATKAATEHGQFSMTEEQRNRLVWDPIREEGA
jgi:hypothetical protein